MFARTCSDVLPTFTERGFITVQGLHRTKPPSVTAVWKEVALLTGRRRGSSDALDLGRKEVIMPGCAVGCSERCVTRVT